MFAIKINLLGYIRFSFLVPNVFSFHIYFILGLALVLAIFFCTLSHSLVITFAFGDTHDLFRIKTLSIDSNTTTDHHLLFLVLSPNISLLHFLIYLCSCVFCYDLKLVGIANHSPQ
jgi:hypothetical protein